MTLPGYVKETIETPPYRFTCQKDFLTVCELVAILKDILFFRTESCPGPGPTYFLYQKCFAVFYTKLKKNFEKKMLYKN